MIGEPLKAARQKIASWLRDGALDGHPLFVLGHPLTDDCPTNVAMSERFCQHVRRAGFELVADGNGPTKTFHWEFQGRPVPDVHPISAELVRDNQLLACVALLESAAFRRIGAVPRPSSLRTGSAA